MTTGNSVVPAALRAPLRSRRWLPVAWLVLVAAPGCVGEIGDSDRRSSGAAGPGAEPNAHAEPAGDVPAIDSETVIVNPAATRRLTVDELQASLAVVAGTDAAGTPIGWTVMIAKKPVDGLADQGYGKTLGRPDFVTRTEEDASPNPLWGKFTQDMARNVCSTMVLADLARADGETPTLWPHADVEKNLAHLVLRFWGFGASEAAETVETLLPVYAAGVAADVADDDVPAEAEGWRAVCVALIEDPAFHLH